MQADFSRMTASQLVDFYNRHSTKPIKRFSDRKTAERRCSELLKELETTNTTKTLKQKVEVTRLAMRNSLKLDRRITCVETGKVWKNAHQMWVDHPDWMSSGQQDRLTAKLYTAAKNGDQVSVTLNNRTFCLFNVPKV